MPPQQDTASLFRCDICCQEFTRAYSLRRHQLVHKEDRAFSCFSCKKQFRYENDCKIHERRHFECAEFICECCGRRLASAWSLKRHEKSCLAGSRTQSPQRGIFQQTREPEASCTSIPDSTSQETSDRFLPPLQTYPTGFQDDMVEDQMERCSDSRHLSRTELIEDTSDLSALDPRLMSDHASRTDHHKNAALMTESDELEISFKILTRIMSEDYDPGSCAQYPQTVYERAWFIAARKGMCKALRCLHQHHHVDLESRTPEGGNSALHISVTMGYVDVVRLLLQLGSQVNSVNARQYTPLHFAVEFGQISCALELLDNDAVDVHVHNLVGYSPLHIEVSSEFDHGVFKAMLAKSRNIDDPDSFGSTVLHYAAKSADASRLVMILDKKANLDAKTIYGDTALQIATGSRRLDSMTLLLNAGASVKAANNRGKTSLHLATSPASVRLLLGYGADIKARDKDGNTPLMAAASGEVVNALLAESRL